MRRMACAVLVLLAATAVEAQMLSVGGAANWSWDWRPATNPGTNFARNEAVGGAVFVALAVSQDTFVRFRVADVPHDVPTPGGTAKGTFRAYTIGVDYLLEGVFGDAVVSAGLGSYNARVSKQPMVVPEYDGHKFGWYVGVGEWFRISRQWRALCEINLHKTEHSDKPTIVTGSAGLSFSF